MNLLGQLLPVFLHSHIFGTKAMRKAGSGAAAAILAALHFTFIAARPQLPPLSKAGKIIDIGSKSSKVGSLSLSMSMDHTEFGSPLFDASLIISPSPTPFPSATESSRTPNVPSLPTYAPSEASYDTHAGLFDDYTTKFALPFPSHKVTTPSHVPSDELDSVFNSCIVDVSASIFGHELQYYYRLETKLFDPSTVDRIERELTEMVCSDVTEKGRILTSNATHENMATVSELPKDVESSTYGCRPQTAPAQYCQVIVGGLTLSFKVDNLLLQDIFDSIAADDPNIVKVEYLVNLNSLEQIESHAKVEGFIESKTDAAIPTTMILVSALVAVGVLGTMLVLILGRADGHVHGKQVKDDASSAIATSDMSTVMSPTRAAPKITEVDIKRWPNPFIVSEQEEITWQNWGIISAPSKSRLESIKEEMWSDEEFFDEMSI